MRHINIEIKARCDFIDRIRDILISKEADFKGVDHQIDTYFNVKKGRLKLREGEIENYLIYYDRIDQSGPKRSDVLLFKTEKETELRELLTVSNGIRVVVDKMREIFFIDNVKFHLDKVKNLGEFVEIEAIASGEKSDGLNLLDQCKYYMHLFDINESDLIENSYSDLLLEKGNHV